ncbi:hypothetical protein TYRP_007654 [Tyrophagus putrescentiae]|nr:hypothetical protein TYRP_007654 [Tyrophagus putrescentiae]
MHCQLEFGHFINKKEVVLPAGNRRNCHRTGDLVLTGKHRRCQISAVLRAPDRNLRVIHIGQLLDVRQSHLQVLQLRLSQLLVHRVQVPVALVGAAPGVHPRRDVLPPTAGQAVRLDDQRVLGVVQFVHSRRDDQLQANVVGVRRQNGVVSNLGHHSSACPTAQCRAVVQHLEHHLSVSVHEVVRGKVGPHALQHKVAAVGGEAGAVEKAALVYAAANAADDLPLV